MKRFLLILFALIAIKGFSQYPISSINITLPAQPPANTNAWANGLPPFMIMAQAKLVNGQVPGNVVESRILVTIKSGGAKVCGAYMSNNAPRSNFNTAVKNWTGNAATALLGDSCKLRPGSYELCVQFFTLNAPAMPLSNEVCKPFVIQETQEVKYTAPQNISPENGKQFTAKDLNGVITFRWTPVVPKPREAVKYILRIWEVPEGSNPQQVKTNNKPFLEKEVNNQTQLIIPGSQFRLGKRSNGLVWIVEAVSAETVPGGNPKSFGKSEGNSFRINLSPNSPLTICNDVTISSIDVTCQGIVNGTPQYFLHDKITNNSGKNIVSWTLTSSSGNLADFSPQSIPAYSFINTQAIRLTDAVPDANHFVFATYTFTFDDNSTCTSGKDILLPDCNASCTCGQWGNIQFNVPSTTGGATLHFSAACSGNDTVRIPPNAIFSIAPAYTCAGNNCQAFYKYDVFFQNGVKLYDNVNASVIDPQEMNTCGEVYKIVIKPSCCLTACVQCSPCTVYLKRNCPVSSCQCATHPTVIKRTAAGGTVQEIPFTCNPAVPYIDKLNCNANDTIIVKNFCTGTCPAQSASLSIRRPDGTTFTQPVWSTAPGEVWFILPPSNQNGIYNITVSTSCGNQPCSNCIIDFRQNCPPPPCGCGSWGPVSLHTSPGTLPVVTKNCSDTFSISPGYDYYFSGNQCTGNPGPPTYCMGGNTYDIFKSDGTPVYINLTSVFSGNLLNLCNEVYRVVIKPGCGGQSCTPCTVYVKRTCPPACSCGAWSTVVFRAETVPGMPTNISRHCLDTLSLGKDVNFTISPIYNCAGNNCNATFLYDVFLSGGMQIYSNVTASQIVSGQLNSCGEVYRIVIKPTCGSQTCSPCTVYLKRTCVSCTCGTWTDTKATYTVLSTLQKDDPVSCGKGITVDCNKPVTISWNFNCIGQCAPATTVAVYPPSGGRPVGMAGGNSITFTPTILTGGPYKVVLKGTCGNNTCDSCIIYVTPKCSNCDCGKWNGVKVNGKRYECNAKAISWKCNTEAAFSADYQCAPNNETCRASISWDIKQDGKLIKSGGGSNTGAGSFTPTANGNYIITFYPLCNNKNCPPCSVTLSVTDCMDCNCEKFTFTGTVTSTGKNKEGKCTYAFDGFAFNPCEENKTLSLSASAGLSFSPASISLNQGNNPVHFVVNNLTGTSSGAINATILINGKKCERRFEISFPPCDVCECGSWKNITGRYFINNTEKQKELQCGDSLAVDCNKSFKLTADYNCIGNKCDKTMLYYVEGPDGTELVSGESLPVNFTPTKDGVYKIILRTNCGSGACPDCVIYLKVSCPPPPCDFCKDFTETLLTQKSYKYGADNNQLDLTQSLNIPAQYKIKQVKAELVAFDWQTDNVDCRKCQKNTMAFGVLSEAVLKANGIEYEGVVPKAIFNTHELDINCLPASGSQLGSGSNIKLGISLPWQTSLSCCGDKFSFCVRYTIVTTDCKTCSIVKCYTDVPVRQHKIINNGDGKGN